MKKRTLFTVILVAAVLILGACKTTKSDDKTSNETEISKEERNEEAVTYYGCPNSKRVKKLNLKKVL